MDAVVPDVCADGSDDDGGGRGILALVVAVITVLAKKAFGSRMVQSIT